jgi:uncharacterized protein
MNKKAEATVKEHKSSGQPLAPTADLHPQNREPVALEAKRARLHEIIASLDSVGVAFSGGTDSSYLLAVCLDVLGAERVLALTADSPLSPRSELAEARALAAQLGARHRVIPLDDLTNLQIVANPPERCYHCKFSRFEMLLTLLEAEGLGLLVHGENADDAMDYRPGSRAAQELGVRAPLREAGLTKAEVRSLSRTRGLANWDRPANACLASRFPYGTRLTAEGLARVEQAEEALKQAWSLQHLRVRDHFPVARVEAPPEQIARLASPELRALAVTKLRALGYRFVALDLAGYRMGSLNDELDRSKV